MSIIDTIKKEIGFMEQPCCKNCCFSNKIEELSDGGIILYCEYAGKISFSVEENEYCLKWESI